jgi:hypothetical protein
MIEVTSGHRLCIMRLILVPALISLAVTVLRLVGELKHWSEKWFSPDSGGIVPSGLSWLVGITWLALPFGAYFALKLAAMGQGPPQLGRAIKYAVLGLTFLLSGRFLLIPILPTGFPEILVFVWLIMTLAAAIQFFGWPALSRTLLWYGLAARIPVAVVMFFAMRGNWGTHYDYVGMPPQFQLGLWPKYVWLGFFPQMVFWVGFTILMGSLSGTIAVALSHRWRPALPVHGVGVNESRSREV